MPKSNFIVRGGGDFSGIKKEIVKTQSVLTGFQKNVQGSFKKSFVGIGKLLASALAVREVINFGKNSVAAAQTASSAFAGLQSVVEGNGRSMSQATTFLKEYTKDGLVPATQAAAAYRDLVAAKYDTTQIEDIMEAFKNSAIYSRQAGFAIGEAIETGSAGLKNTISNNVDNVGVTKNLSVMQKEYAKSIGKTVGQLTEAEVRQAHYLGIMEATKFQMRDAANYSQTYGGAVSRLTASFSTFKETVGDSLIMVIKPIVQWLDILMQKMIQVAAVVRSFVAALTGTSFKQLEADKASASIAAVGASADSMSESAENMGNAVAGSAKKVKKALAGFDDVNILNTSVNDASGGGGSGAGAEIPAIEIPKIDDIIPKLDMSLAETGISNFIARIKEMFEPARASIQAFWDSLAPVKDFAFTALTDFYKSFLEPVGKWTVSEGIPRFFDAMTNAVKNTDWSKLNDSLNNLWKALTPFTINIGEGLLWLWENVLMRFATWTANNVVPLFLDGLAATINVLNGVIEALKPSASWLWVNFLEPLAKWTGEVIVGALTWVVEKLQAFSDWIKENGSLIAGLAATIGILVASFKAASVIMAVVPMVTTALSAIMSTIASFSSVTTVAAVAIKVLGAIIGFLTSPVVILTALIASFVYTIMTVPEEMERLKQNLSIIWDNIVKIFEQAVGFIELVIADTLELVKKNWDEHFKAVVVGIGTAVNDIIEWITKLVDGFITPIISQCLGWLTHIWNDSLKGIVDEVLGFVGRVGELLVALWEYFIKPTFDFLTTYVVPVVKEAFSITVDYIGGAVSIIGDIIKALLGILNGIIDFLVGVFTGDWSKAWSGISKIFENIFEGMIKISKNVANMIIDTINGMIRLIATGINSLTGIASNIKIPNTDIGINIPKITPPQIPKLAKGGIVTQPTLAMIGERGKEAVVPLENNTEWMNKMSTAIVDKLAGALSGGGFNQGEREITIKFAGDGADLVSMLLPQIVDGINGITNQRGGTPLKV